MLDRCTDAARNALQIATHRAKLHHRGLPNDVDLLIGVLEDAAAAVRMFHAAGVDPVRVRFEAEKNPQGGSEESGHARFDAALAAAILKSHQCRHAAIGTEHLLFGLLSDGSGALSSLLADFGIPRRRLDRIVKRRLSRFPLDEAAENARKAAKQKTMAMALPRTIGSRIVAGIASLFVLPLGALGCFTCVGIWLGLAGKKQAALGAVVVCIVFVLCLTIGLMAAASLIWAVAAPKWLEKFLQSLAKKTVWWFLILVAFVLVCIVCAS